jgi:aspartate/methionine/tyrosine aminotransferase
MASPTLAATSPPPNVGLPPGLPPALAAIRETIARVPLENISGLARGALGDPSIIPLWFCESDLRPPPFLAQALTQAIDEGHVFYTEQNGIAPLREALAAYLVGLGAREVGADRITVTAGGMNALVLAMMLVAGAGDNVIVIDPVWPNLGGIARLLGAQVRSVSMDLTAEGWRLDPAKAAAAMDGRTRAIFFASPGNPTGAVLPMATQAALLELCRARGAWLIADEVYHRVIFDAARSPTICDIAAPEDRLMVAHSFSKSWAMTGCRLGWLVHPPSLAPTLAMMVQYTTSGVTTFLQHAGAAVVERGEPSVDVVRAYCKQGMEIVCGALEGFARARLGPRPTAGMYAFFEVEGMTDSRAACLDILRRTGVGMAPGFFFGPGNERFLRICVARSPASLTEAMSRLATVLG